MDCMLLQNLHGEASVFESLSWGKPGSWEGLPSGEAEYFQDPAWKLGETEEQA